MNASILVVDDEAVFRVLAEEALTGEGFEVRTAESLKKARAEFERAAPDVLILDRRMPDGDGIDFLKRLRDDAAGRGDPSSAPVVIVVTAYGDVENAVEALRAGAADYLTKPIQVTDLIVKLDKVLEARGLRDRLRLARTSTARPPLREGRSAAERMLRESLKSVSSSPSTPVLLVGPSGAGKQCAAELLHAMTYENAEDAPFVEVNCAALPAELVESELFGHEKGAFTDARATRRGLVEMADGGTLFLDEVTELPERSQAKLLKFLDAMRFRRVGGEREIAVQLRIVAATNQDVAQMVATGKLREDLFHRISVFSIDVPALRERREDIPDLAEAFVEFFAQRVKKRVSGLSRGARDKLVQYDYPGNVRELRNIVERAVILTRAQEIQLDDIVLPRTESAAHGTYPAFFSVDLKLDGDPPTAEQIEQAYVKRVLDYYAGKRTQAAQALGVSYPTFLRRLRELGLDE
jgi:two-component system response regulator AtoC